MLANLKVKPHTFFCVIFLQTMCVNAYAQPVHPHEKSWQPAESKLPLQWSVSLGQTAYSLNETSPSGAVLSSEKGRLPVLGVQLAFTSHNPDFEWHVRGAVSRAQGDTQYLGRTQLGLPLKTSSAMVLQDAQIKLGRTWREAGSKDGLAFTLGAALRQASTDRDIRPSLFSSPLREKLNVTQVGVEASVDLRPLRFFNTTLGTQFSAQFFKTLSSTLAVDSYARYDPITLHPARGYAAKIGTKHTVAFNENSQLALHLSYDTLTAKRSDTAGWTRNGTPSASIYYPGSVQKRTDVHLSYQQRF